MLPNSEVSQRCEIVVVIKESHKIAGISLGRQEISVYITGNEVFQEFWSTTGREISVSKKNNFHQQPIHVILFFRTSSRSESIHDAMCRVREEVNSSRPLMKSSTRNRMDIVIKYGAPLSEMNPFTKAVFGVLSATFELLKKHQEYNDAISSLVERLDRLIPFMEQVVEDSVHDNMEILKRVIERLHNLTIDVAEFTCDYVQRGRLKPSRMSRGSLQIGERIIELKDGLGRLVEDLDRAIGVEAFNTARRNGELNSLF
ncbi:hypothetical protein CPB86DRAFT_819499 [Serendipita vermifera]|nr:hypothetical protein CPB86DRAFT_819499 [Serendipita vermifera]